MHGVIMRSVAAIIKIGAEKTGRASCPSYSDQRAGRIIGAEKLLSEDRVARLPL